MAKKKSLSSNQAALAESVIPAAPLRQVGRAKLSSMIIMLAASALMLLLLFPPFFCFFLAPIALVPFCICILRRPMNWRYLGFYYLMGAAFYCASLFWLWPVTAGGYLALALFVALYFPLFALGVHRLVNQMRLPAMVAVPLVWTAVEFLRASFVLGGFPWFLLGNCLAPSAILIQTADLFGVWGLTFLIAMMNGFLVDVLRLPLRQGGRFSPIIGRQVAIMSMITAGAVAYGVYRLGEKTIQPGPLVAVIQENIPQSLKEKPGASNDIFLSHLRLTDEALAKSPKPDLVVWPETMVTQPINSEVTLATPDQFSNDDELKRRLAQLSELESSQQSSLAEYHIIADFYEALTQRVEKSGVPLLVGYGAEIPETPDSPYKRYNRTLLLTPAGAGLPGVIRSGEYSKRHIVPFGEFIPFRGVPVLDSIVRYLTPVKTDYSLTRGDEWTRFTLMLAHEWRTGTASAATSTATSPLQTAPASEPMTITRTLRRYTFATPICFEDAMPYPCRMMSAPQFAEGRKADFLLNVSNDGWFWPVELDQHLQACQLRAVENRIAIARSVNTGNSGFIDSNGRIMGLVRDANGQSIGAVGTLAMVLPIDARVTLYAKIGDLFPIMCGIVSTLLVGWTFVRPRRTVRREPPAEIAD